MGVKRESFDDIGYGALLQMTLDPRAKWSKNGKDDLINLTSQGYHIPPNTPTELGQIPSVSIAGYFTRINNNGITLSPDWDSFKRAPTQNLGIYDVTLDAIISFRRS